MAVHFALGIDAPIRERMQRLIDHERLLYERLWGVQTPEDFRAVMQMRARLENMRAEVVEKSLALGLPRGGPQWSYVQETKPPAPEVHFEVLARNGDDRLGFGYACAASTRTSYGGYKAAYDMYHINGASATRSSCALMARARGPFRLPSALC